MKLIEQRILRGPNLYARFPCVFSRIDLEELAGVSSADIEGFSDQLSALLPSLANHRCSSGKPGGFLRRLRTGTYIAHIVEHVTLELQCLAGTPVGFGRARRVAGTVGQYRIVCAYRQEKVVLRAFHMAMELVVALAHGRNTDLDGYLSELRALVAREAIGTSTAAVIDAARRHGIPVFRITDDANLFQLGWGAKSKRLSATVTSDTSHIAVNIASDKHLTKALLEQAGIRVPKGHVVETVEDARKAADWLKCPVTIKPLDGNQGKGVTTGCVTALAISQAFATARRYSRKIIVERHIEGRDYRVLVSGGVVAAAALRRPPCVTGDGVHTVRELVDVENARPERGWGHTNILTKIPIDEIAQALICDQGLALDAVVPKNVKVALRGNANLSTGGTSEDVTDALPECTRAMCIRAARIIGLDVAGIDIVCGDISQPLEAQQGCIIEVNAAPGLRMHEHPGSGLRRDAGEAIATAMFGDGNGRIPVIAVTGTNGKTTTSLLLAHTVRLNGLRVGVTTTEGVNVNGSMIEQGDCTGYWSARTVLSSPDVDVAVLETARGGILKRGLAFDKCDIAVVLNVTEDHLGMDGINTVGQLAQVKAVVANTASRAVVLNAQDAHCVAMASQLALPRPEVIFFSLDADCEVLLPHFLNGGSGVFLRDSTIWIRQGNQAQALIDVADIPIAMGGHARYNIANALAATAGLLALHLSCDSIIAGLRSFRCDARSNPLRSNVFRLLDFTVIVDYAHNAAACQAVGEMVQSLSGGTARSAIGVVTAPGDRRDCDLHQIGMACGRVFDDVIVYEAEPRGRQRGETAQHICHGARDVAPLRQVRSIPDVQEALAYALRQCGCGDVLVFACGSSLDVLVTAVRAFNAGAADELVAQINGTWEKGDFPLLISRPEDSQALAGFSR
jgi:cyanophycin synthetase